MSKSQPVNNEEALLALMLEVEQGAFNPAAGLIDNIPAWAWAIQKGSIKALETCIDMSGVIQGHDEEGRSFLVACLDEHVPMGLVVLGLSKSSDDWWEPGVDGRNAFEHENLDVALANVLGQRLWAKGLWRKAKASLGDRMVGRSESRARRMILSWMPPGG